MAIPISTMIGVVLNASVIAVLPNPIVTSDYLSKCNHRANSNNYGGLCSHIFSALCR
ncbi:hypothetical protein wTpre_1264 [Wolbachia endosymbiont of Trichogramma pretiosum]|nr:hypothetical protein wTpre_1264 [Wolbachia endosymbiont of Trichogramma pretiosum]